MTRGVLLVNLGTPASTAVSDVRSFLREFLTDPYVIDLPAPLRQIIVSAFILPFRPRKSAAAYQKIWDAAGPGTGSPLLHFTRQLGVAVQAALGDTPCEVAMRYGHPGILEALNRLAKAGVTELLLISLYPQHADSTRETTIRAVKAQLPEGLKLEVAPPFFDNPHYLRAQADLIQQNLQQPWDHLLLSFHGLPERHLIKADPTGTHCLQSPDCCEVASNAHQTCYRHQAFETSRKLTAMLNVDPDRYTISFQSRLGRLPWLSPYTDETLIDLAQQGVRNLVVACPAFIADNLETLEEIGIAGRARFLDAGGESLRLVPCLNDDPSWVAVLAQWCRAAQTNWTRSDSA
jgi:ferrochelatase